MITLTREQLAEALQHFADVDARAANPVTEEQFRGALKTHYEWMYGKVEEQTKEVAL